MAEDTESPKSKPAKPSAAAKAPAAAKAKAAVATKAATKAAAKAATKPKPAPPAPSTPTLQQQVDALKWYHTFELPGGIVTPGLFDHTKVVKKLPLPRSLVGKRCLDVAASDGFWSFEMARRGATEVVSLDLPDAAQQDFSGPPRAEDDARHQGSGRANEAFAVVKEATELPVTRVDGSVYDIESLDLGLFDFVFMGNILLHLRDPILALQKVRTVTSHEGEFFSFEAISLPQTILRPFSPTGQFALGDENLFWVPNLLGHRRLVESAGFEIFAHGGPLLQPFGDLWPRFPERRPTTLHEFTYWAFTRQFGAASAWVRSRLRD
jgi:tRNA (mo5U34)-methyltransferase